MARPKKIRNYVDQLLEIDRQIDLNKAAIKSLKEQRKLVAGEKEKTDMSALMNLVRSSGKTPEELLQTLRVPESDTENN